MMRPILAEKITLLLFSSLSVIGFTQQSNSQQGEVFGKSCDEIYIQELGNRTELNFSLSINRLSCDTSAGIFYHCLPDFQDRTKYIEFCGLWVWIEPGKCPAIYLVNDNLQPFTCNSNKTNGCPEMHYKSHLYYKYPGCFPTIQLWNDDGATEMLRSNIPGYGIILIVLFIVIICIVIVVVCYKIRRHPQNEEETPENQRLKPRGQFRHQKAIDAAVKHLKKHKILVIKGIPGSGKTVLIKDVAKEFQHLKTERVKSDYPHFHVRNNDEYLFIIPHDWLTQHGGIERLKLEMKNFHQRSKVIINATENFTKENEDMREFRKCTINLSGEFKLTIEDKLEAIKLRCGADGLSDDCFAIENRRKVAEYECQSYGFFHLLDLIFKRKAFDDPVDFLKEATQDESSSNQNDQVQGVEVVNEKAITNATKHLEEHKLVLITGKPGTGRRTLIEKLKTEFHELKPVDVRLDYPTFNLEGDSPYFVIVMDSWLTRHGGVQKLRSEMNKFNKRSVVVIMATEKFIQEKKEYIEEFKHCTVNLSGEFKLTTEQKLNIITQKCFINNVSDEEFTEEKQQKVAEYECKHYGFFYLVDQLFDEKAFDKPIQFLKEMADKEQEPLW